MGAIFRITHILSLEISEYLRYIADKYDLKKKEGYSRSPVSLGARIRDVSKINTSELLTDVNKQIDLLRNANIPDLRAELAHMPFRFGLNRRRLTTSTTQIFDIDLTGL